MAESYVNQVAASMARGMQLNLRARLADGCGICGERVAVVQYGPVDLEIAGSVMRFSQTVRMLCRRHRNEVIPWRQRSSESV